MASSGDATLLASLAAGRQQAFAELYDRYAERLYRAAAAMLHSREDAEDAVQEVFLAVVRSRHRMTEVKNLTAYLFTSLRHATGRLSKRRQRQPTTNPSALPVEGTTGDRPNRHNPHSERLQRGLQSLPTEQREVITLKIDAELTFAEISEVLGVSINTAASRYRYALDKLRRALKESSP